MLAIRSANLSEQNETNKSMFFTSSIFVFLNHKYQSRNLSVSLFHQTNVYEPKIYFHTNLLNFTTANIS